MFHSTVTVALCYLDPNHSSCDQKSSPKFAMPSAASAYSAMKKMLKRSSGNGIFWHSLHARHLTKEMLMA